jgi:hypothetical protein
MARIKPFSRDPVRVVVGGQIPLARINPRACVDAQTPVARAIGIEAHRVLGIDHAEPRRRRRPLAIASVAADGRRRAACPGADDDPGGRRVLLPRQSVARSTARRDNSTRRRWVSAERLKSPSIRRTAPRPNPGRGPRRRFRWFRRWRRARQLANYGRSPWPLSAPGAQFTPSRIA